jgi:outer membrane protein OmpA-like peptidoglycan-associated protein
MLAAFVFLLVLTGSAVPPQSYADTTPEVAAGGDDGAVMADEGKKDEGEKKEKEKKKSVKGKPRYPYAKELQRKVRKAPPPPKTKPKYKKWSEVTKDAESHEGLIKVWTKQEDVWFELGKDQLDVPMLAISHFSQGIGAYMIYGGLRLDNMMFDLHRHEDHLQIRRLSTEFRAPGDVGLENTIKLTFSKSIVASIKIESEKDDGETILVKMNGYFLSDAVGLGMFMQAVFRQPVRMDPKKGYFNRIATYPENLEIDTRLTFMPAQPFRLNLPSVPDPRYVQVGVHFSIIKLPEEPMMPRFEDDRVGYFTTSYKDFRQTDKSDWFVHMAHRWRLEKKDPDAAISEPVKPIVYYIDHTVPDEYVPYMIAGVEWWQAAFEEAGFKNAIIGKRAPTPEEDPEYCAEDARYSTLRWNTSDQAWYGAIGPSQVDPRTGEILNADILFEHNLVATFGQQFKRYAGPREALMAVDPGLKELWMTDEEKAADISWDDVPMLKNQKHLYCCQLADGLQLEGNFMRIAMLGRGMLPAGGNLPEDYVGEALTWVAAHEVGHTLGLRHNFLSSGSTPYAQLNDKDVIAEIGMTGSVMDYASANVSFDSNKQGYYFGVGIGTCDKWVIKWGYSDVPGDTPEEQQTHLEKIAKEAWKKDNLYGADEDAYPLHALDPRINIFDLSDDPLAWAAERMMICNDLLKNGKLEERVVADGQNYVDLRSSVVTLYIQKYAAARMAVKYIGGQYTARPHKGDPGGHKPLDPVDPADQQKALDFIVSNLFQLDSWTLSPEFLNMLQDDRQWSWENNTFQNGRRYDFPMSLWVGAVQNAVLSYLMNPMLQARVVEAQYKVEKPFKLSSVYSALTREIWTNDPAPRGQYAGLHRNLQRIYLHRLIVQVTTPNAFLPPDATELSRLNLRRIRGSANTALQRQGLDDETNAHLMETIARIDRALEAQRVIGF